MISNGITNRRNFAEEAFDSVSTTSAVPSPSSETSSDGDALLVSESTLFSVKAESALPIVVSF